MSHIHVNKKRYTFKRKGSALKLPAPEAAVLFQAIKNRLRVDIVEDFDSQQMIVSWTWPEVTVEEEAL